MTEVVKDVEFYSEARVTWFSAATCAASTSEAPPLGASSAVKTVEFDVAACIATPVEGPISSDDATSSGRDQRWGEWYSRLRRKSSGGRRSLGARPSADPPTE